MSPPLRHSVWIIQLGCDSHWVLLRLSVVSVHIWEEVALLHFLMELILRIYESSGLLNVVPFLRSLTVSMRPPLG